MPFALAALLLAAGCGGGGKGRDDSTTPSPPGESKAARPDTSRSGPAFLAVYRDGPLDELRVVRATDGRLVVAGLCDFPDGTKISVSLSERRRGSVTTYIAIVGARVERGRFMSPPLAGVGGPPPQGVYGLGIMVVFGPGRQDPAVMAASAGGRRFLGPGVSEQPNGVIMFSTNLEAPL